jgi:hypothetical protein
MIKEDLENSANRRVRKMEEKIIEQEKKLSRRALFAGATKIAAGAAGIAILSTGAQGLFSETRAVEKQKWPWPYKKIDPAKASVIGYEKYYEGACCYGVVNAIMIPLREAIGEPYTSLPLDAFHFGHSGVVGWGTICGTLLGCGLVTGFIAGKPGELILNEVINWYVETPLPLYEPSNPKANIKNKSKGESPLCHISAGRWMDREGVAFGSSQRKERCARLVADVAAKTAIFLNDWSEKKFSSIHDTQMRIYRMPAQNNCTDCHGSNVPNVPR